MSNNTSIYFHYKGAQIHCESDCGAPDTKSAVEAVDQALTAAGVTTFARGPMFGATASTQPAGPDVNEVGGSDADDSAEDKAAAEAEAKAKADAKAKKAADKKAADKKAADEKAAAKKKADAEKADDAAEKAAREEAEGDGEEQSEDAGDGDEGPGDKPAITLEDLRDQVMVYAKENGNVQGKRLVQEVGGAEKISNVPEDKWLELYKAAGGEV